MDTIKFILLSIIVLIFLGLVGYWAVINLESGTEHANSSKLADLQKENDSLKKQLVDLNDQLNTYKTKNTEAVIPTPVIPVPTTTTPKPDTTKTTTYKNQSLINELSQLVTDKITMKLHSAGTRVGTVQKFLNLYNKTNTKIDNDYGATTVKLVTAFQKDQGLTADGVASTSTFSKMIDWLKKQG